jgi:hypothetical protein
LSYFQFRVHINTTATNICVDFFWCGHISSFLLYKYLTCGTGSPYGKYILNFIGNY